MVTLFHVVEHFYNPTEELDWIFKILKPNGLLIIETPNANDALLSKYENISFQNFTYWSHHPMLHSHVSIEGMVKKAGFAILDNHGTQRYDLNNHLNWLLNKKPGGHIILKNLANEKTNKNYKRLLIEKKLADTLIIIAKLND